MTQMPTIPLPARLLKVSLAQAGPAAPAPAAPAPSAEQMADACAKLVQQERAALASAAAALKEGLAQLQPLRAATIRQSEQQLVELAMNIASRVLMQEIQAGRYEIDPIVQEALGRVSSHQDVVVHLHPDDLARCAQAKTGDEAGIAFVADANIARAHCRIETAEGVVESDVESHLETIGNGFRGGES